MIEKIFEYFFRIFITISILYCFVAVYIIFCYDNDMSDIYNNIVMENPIEHYYETDLGFRLHQCILPVHYVISDDIPIYLYPIIKDAFEYWNYYAEFPIFEFVGEVDEYVNNPLGFGSGLVMIGVDSKNDKTYYGYADFGLVATGGCLSSTEIRLSPWTLNEINIVVSNTMRHEIGHILGLRHNLTESALMYPTLNIKHRFLDINDVEFKAFKVFY